MEIRTAIINDLEQISKVESECFPKAEAATIIQFSERLKYYANHFLLLFDGETLISFVDGMVTNEENLTDEMYDNPSMHNEQGAWQMIFGVNTIPKYRKKGYAGRLLKEFILYAKEEKRSGVVLTCKQELISYYEKFGFICEGKSSSKHGNVTWYQMRLKF